MKRPVIGVTVDYNDEGKDRYQSNKNYAAAVERAGGLPVLLPYAVDVALVTQYADLIDGMLFTGGNDLDPSSYGETWHAKAVAIDPPRQKFEMALLAEVEKRRTPMLGVCLGSQLINVHRGGTLTQFLPDIAGNDPLEHRRLPGQEPTRHPIQLDVESMLGKAIGKFDVSVNTYHKQGVKKLGRGLKATATAPDGLIEAFEDPSFPMLVAVQWHPERLADEVEHLAPFKLLVEHARSSR